MLITPTPRHPIFRLRKMTLPHHNIKLESAPNFRDFGGLNGADGRQIRVGKLYRSEALSRLSDADMHHIIGLNIELVVDLRTTDERVRSRNRWPESGIVEIITGLDAKELNAVTLFGWRERIADPTFDAPGARLWMQDAYAKMPYLFSGFLTTVFKRLSTVAPSPTYSAPNPIPTILLHCTAGKDRTGFMSAMLQLALGVSHNDVMQSYLLTRERKSPEQLLQTLLHQELAQASDTSRAALLTIADVDADYLSHALRTIETDFGSLHTYFMQACDMNTAKLQQLQTNLLE